MARNQLQEWVEARRKAAEAERLERFHEGPRPEYAIRSALALIALYGRMHGWPPVEDEVSRREDAASRETWARLRARWLKANRRGP
jgi:hypothetical protein